MRRAAAAHMFSVKRSFGSSFCKAFAPSSVTFDLPMRSVSSSVRNVSRATPASPTCVSKRLSFFSFG